MTPPSGGEPTPARGFPYVSCPHCHKPLPRFAFPAATVEAQEPTRAEERAAELEDATPTVAHPVNPRLAQTDRIERPRP